MFDHHASLPRATEEGCRGLVDELVAKGARCVALLVAQGAPVELEALVAGLAGAGAEVMGAIFPGLIVGRALLREGALALGFSSGARRVVFPDLGAAAPELESEMSRLYTAGRSPRPPSVLLFLDAVSGASHVGRFLETLQLYFHVSARYVGGGAGRSDLSAKPCLFTETEVLPPGGGMALRVERELSVSYRHGWTKLAGPFFVSRSENTLVLELDWRPAAEVYAEVLRQEGLLGTLESMDFAKMSPLYPLGLLKLGELVVVRDLLAMTPEGGLRTFGRIPQHSVLSILRGEPDALIGAAKQVATEVSSSPPGHRSGGGTFVADCVTREIALGPRYAEELAVLGDAFEDRAVGALTLGEVASGRDRFVDFFNKTIVVGTG